MGRIAAQPGEAVAFVVDRGSQTPAPHHPMHTSLAPRGTTNFIGGQDAEKGEGAGQRPQTPSITLITVNRGDQQGSVPGLQPIPRFFKAENGFVGPPRQADKIKAALEDLIFNEAGQAAGDHHFGTSRAAKQIAATGQLERVPVRLQPQATPWQPTGNIGDDTAVWGDNEPYKFTGRPNGAGHKTTTHGYRRVWLSRGLSARPVRPRRQRRLLLFGRRG